MIYLKEWFLQVPVDFEEVELTSSLADDSLENAIIAIKRNGIAIKVR